MLQLGTQFLSIHTVGLPTASIETMPTWSLFSCCVLVILECTKHTDFAADLTELCWTELATFQQPLQPCQLCGEVVRTLHIVRGKLIICCEDAANCKASRKTDRVIHYTSRCLSVMPEATVDMSYVSVAHCLYRRAHTQQYQSRFASTC